MLYGELPFDEENVNTMFKKIRDAKYYMKGAASIEAKDLLNRMMQPNPFNRITIHEIKSHPWFSQNICKYLLEPFVITKLNGGHKSLDNELVDKLFTLNLSINEDDRKEIEAAILKGELYDFCVAYEYLFHQKTIKRIKLRNSIEQTEKHSFNLNLLTRYCNYLKRAYKPT